MTLICTWNTCAGTRIIVDKGYRGYVHGKRIYPRVYECESGYEMKAF
jgi:hypothetical protein